MIIGKLPRQLFSKLQRMATEVLQTHSYVWIDLEMTGLDPDKDKILEISCIVTNPQLEPMHSGLTHVIHQPDDVLSSMNSWCINHHGKVCKYLISDLSFPDASLWAFPGLKKIPLETGLTEASRNSKTSISEAEKEIADYIKFHSKGNRYLAGNSVYMDKMFLMKYMPSVDKLLHYRILDVSCLKLLMSDWYPEEFLKLPKKRLNHRAQDDILESIEELKNYRKTFFK